MQVKIFWFSIFFSFQIISNDEYKSVQHRVVANSGEESRVSIGTFFGLGKREESDIYGLLLELISTQNRLDIVM